METLQNHFQSYIPCETKNGSPLFVYASINLKMVKWGLLATLKAPPTLLSKIPFFLAPPSVQGLL